MCLRKECPKPLFRCAPVISPGMSATVIDMGRMSKAGWYQYATHFVSYPWNWTLNKNEYDQKNEPTIFLPSGVHTKPKTDP